MRANPIFVTVGHSTDSLEDFIARIQSAHVTALADVRTLAGSSKFPHFNSEVLEIELPRHGITYSRIEKLGGLRPRAKDVDATVNGFWQNRSFHNYADYALSDEFAEGLEALIALASRPKETFKRRDLAKRQNLSRPRHSTDANAKIAIMCAEAVWWRCHRRIIADYLLARGFNVEHLMPQGRLTAATLTPGAVIEEVAGKSNVDGTTAPTAKTETRVRYPRE